MTRKKKIIIAIIVAVILVIAVYAVIKIRAKKKLENETGNNNSTGSSGSSVGSSSATDNFPLKKGSKGTRTTNLQRTCNYHNTIPYLPLVEDGIWGDKTEATMLRLFGINSVNENQYSEILETAKGISFTSVPSTAFTNKLKSLA